MFKDLKISAISFHSQSNFLNHYAKRPFRDFGTF